MKENEQEMRATAKEPQAATRTLQHVTESNINDLLVFSSESNFETAMRMAKALSASSIVPLIYQGEKGLPNCIIALEMANRMGASPMMIMQNLYIVHGNPGWSSKFLIATLNNSGKFSPLRYEEQYEGTDKWRCRAYAIEKSSGETLKGAWVSLDMAKKDGWYSKANSKWQTMPQLMLQYRAAAFFQRVYAPEISMGMQTAEEVADTVNVECEEVTTEQRVKKEVQEKANVHEIEIKEEVSIEETTTTQKVPQPIKEQGIPDMFK